VHTSDFALTRRSLRKPMQISSEVYACPGVVSELVPTTLTLEPFGGEDKFCCFGRLPPFAALCMGLQGCDGRRLQASGQEGGSGIASGLWAGCVTGLDSVVTDRAACCTR
jgi:hypothetical protein